MENQLLAPIQELLILLSRPTSLHFQLIKFIHSSYRTHVLSCTTGGNAQMQEWL